MQQSCLERHSRSQETLIKIHMQSLPVFVPWYMLSFQSSRRRQAYKSEAPSAPNTSDQSSLSANALPLSLPENGETDLSKTFSTPQVHPKGLHIKGHLFKQVFVENSYRGNLGVELGFKLGLLVESFFLVNLDSIFRGKNFHLLKTN